MATGWVGPEVAERFAELKPGFGARTAAVEANRCLNCFDAPCMGACPTHIDVAGFIQKIASGNIAGSARTILEANVLGASCGRVCPVEVLCEGACVMHGKGERPIEIGRLQRFAVERFYDAGGRLELGVRGERAERVVCVGAGPASLACAAELRQLGFQVTVVDKRELLGGLNTYGVAEYKLRVADSVREVEMIGGLGVEFVRRHLDAAGLGELAREYDAVFLGMGLGERRRLRGEGWDSERVVDALEFIEGYKTGVRLGVGRRVVVIGAGNTAMDAACAAKRLGAESVTVVYRRGGEDVSAFDFEYEHALREGVRFVWGAVPVRISEGGVECVRVEVDASGTMGVVAGSEFGMECELVIEAIGQTGMEGMLAGVSGMEMVGGRVVVDRETGQTGNAKYFAGGDCVNGGREVVDAVADGKRAARGIAAWLMGTAASAGTKTTANTEILGFAQNDELSIDARNGDPFIGEVTHG
ncbi:MAG TPA: FAD-dependent oxidoreductase [Acidobacteriaceae bacterium]|nr:FAD-dependent oxidoreductase [Acidobacteriaceae bacterium]